MQGRMYGMIELCKEIFWGRDCIVIELCMNDFYYEDCK